MSIAADGFQWIDHIRESDRTEWNRLADQYDTPLLDWDWLRVLEESGSVSPEYGWIPQHLLLRKEGRLIAAAPLYVKTQSAGEFVFDYAWADVAGQLGIPYYPKLVAMSPLSPAIGYRFLIDRAENQRDVVAAMIAIIHRFCTANSLNGFSILWPEADFAESVGTDGFTPWSHQHFRWENNGMTSFEDYLAVFNKNQRRNIRRERASMEEQQLRVEAVPGIQAPESFYGLMYEYYSSTNDQFGPWAARYLTEEFFLMLPQACPERLLFTAAWEPGATDPVGMSLLLHKPNRMIGRYWGARDFVNNLHFNLCYYEPIDWAIRNKVSEFDPGMGSAHKIRRGFQAVSTSSLHHFYDGRMQTVMQMNIDRVNEYEQTSIDELNAGLPFARR
jgi:uncharacterized protein